MKITDYEIVYGKDMAHLTQKIWDLIQTDWQPYGGVVVDPRNGLCYQAVVKYEEEK